MPVGQWCQKVVLFVIVIGGPSMFCFAKWIAHGKTDVMELTFLSYGTQACSILQPWLHLILTAR